MAIPPSIIKPSTSIGQALKHKVNSLILEQFDPFHRETTVPSVKVAVQKISETRLNLKVYGMRADLGGDSSSAIIETPDKKQAAYFIGDEIIPGVILEHVEIDYVILDRNGEKERLSREGREERLGALGRTITVSQATLSFKARDMINNLSFYPYRQGANVLGYQVRSHRGSALEDFGFQRDDIITSIYGQSLTSNMVNLPLLWKDFMLAPRATIQIIRDGVPMSIEVNLK